MLIVDDEVSILNLVASVLTDNGYSCITCERGKDALDVYSRKHAEIDLAILDILMPEMSGPELFEEMKKINPSVRVVMSTGYSMLNEKKLLGDGVLNFIPKPYELSLFLKTVRETLDRKT